jgi:hypothetical protein
MYDKDFIQGLLKKNEKKLARSFNFTFRYADDVLSLNNSRFSDFVDRIYLIGLEIEDTQKVEHVGDITFRELFGRISVFLQNKICPFLAQGICIYVGHSFF